MMKFNETTEIQTNKFFIKKKMMEIREKIIKKLKKMNSIILNFVFKNIAIIHKGTFIAKIKSTLLLSIAASIPVSIFDALVHWTVNNQVYIQFVFGAIIFDHILGTVIHAFIKRDFYWKTNITGFLVKVGMVVIVGYLFEGVAYIIKEESFVKDYLNIMLRLIVFLYPASSAFANCSIITKGKFPPTSILKRFAKFQENLSVKDLKKDDGKR